MSPKGGIGVRIAYFSHLDKNGVSNILKLTIWLKEKRSFRLTLKRK